MVEARGFEPLSEDNDTYAGLPHGCSHGFGFLLCEHAVLHAPFCYNFVYFTL